ncbi:uncharacterized protein LOC110932011 [Helianthus annuus]|uniref:uncharacterized protein LOC110932011 n=1 Tax=Helianthus annuus TaxID=4232 RepID=UPI000B8F9FA4|nr:uncharacterized protein LOC110932011 [Helianthus annuus]
MLRTAKIIFPDLFKLEKEKRCKVADRVNYQVEGSGIGSSYVWAWARNISAGREVDQLVELCNRLLNVRLEDRQDKWEWIGAEDKEFSVGAVKRLLNKEGQHNFVLQDIPEECKWIPEKCNIFMWRTAMNRIATVEALRKRNIEVQEDTCALCRDEEDSVAHIFSSCYVASVVWQQISRWYTTNNLFFFSFKDITEIHGHVGFTGDKKEAFKGIVRIAIWSIWKARNKARFENKEIRIGEIISDLKASSYLWFKNRTRFKDLSWLEWCKFVIM